ncbi:hypothetical protein F383_32462 [Gossypium arboreum]|uniref:Uncharacterized protein n=1 Tax=Gossypium arboreum TaxID=29729 RepID=A0A0B0PPA9_GOSAR|nr:hypothetical protein F383_32462 [Gossypium arboreum]
MYKLQFISNDFSLLTTECFIYCP